MKLSADLKLTIRTWGIIVAIFLWVLVWSFGIFTLVGHRDPTWSYDTPPVLPGESRYTTEAAGADEPPPQVTYPEGAGSNAP